MAAKEVIVEELKNGINKETGKSVEIAMDSQDRVSVCDYDGNILEQYPAENEARGKYLIY